MKKVLPILLLLFVAVSSVIYFLKPKSLQAYKGQLIEMEGEEEEQEDDMEAAMRQEFELTKDPRLNVVPKERLLFAAQVRDRKLAALRTSAPVSGINWAERGPNNVGGRTRALIYDLNDAANGYKKVWAGSVSGGLWFTNDITAATPVWNKVNDFLPNLAITSLAQNPVNPQEMYAGTGEGWFNVDAVRGLGIFKSSDGGVTWNLLPNASSSDFFRIQKIVVTPTGTILAATRQGGLQRSDNGGTTWTKVLGTGVGGGTMNGFADIEVAANGHVYASTGIVSIGPGMIYRSTNDGATWTNIYLSTTSSSNEQRVELACAPSNPNRIYALIQHSNQAIKKIMTTSTATAATPTWDSLPNPTWCDQGSTSTDFTRGQAWYDLIAAVDPTNEATVFIGGVDIFKSTNTGAAWTQVTQWNANCGSLPVVHADQHIFVFRPDATTAPGANNEFLVGNDGGVYRTVNGGTAYAARNNGYNVTQYYGVAMHPTLPNYFLAGSQDNGTQKFTAAGINTTTQASGGDGTFPHIDQNNGNIQITSTPNNNYFVSTDGGVNFIRRIFNNNGDFVNPTDYDDAGKRLYAANLPVTGGAVPNGGGSYLRWNDPATAGSSTTTVQVPQIVSAITHVQVSPLTPNRVYFGFANGSIIRVDSANTGSSKTGVVIKPVAASLGSVSCIAIDPANENHMLVTYSNYGVISVWESTNANAASPVWSSVEGDLPDMPVRWAIFDPRNADMAIIATELGVWSTDDLNSAGTTQWSATNTGLANVRVDMLQYRPGDRTIVAATHGRGLFTATVPNTTSPDVNFATGISTNPEATTTTTAGCRNFKDYTVQVTIANAPVGIATINIEVDPSSTARPGIDYDFTTNGDFNSPSASFNFVPAGSQTQNITVRVYDDAEVEMDEFVKFTYNITGASNAQRGAGFQTLSFNISDNDLAPALPATALYQVGSLNFYIEGNAGQVAPLDARAASKRTQIIYKASELIAAGVPKGRINNLALPINRRSTRAYQNLTIKMGHTTRVNLVENSMFYTQTTTTVKNPYTFTPATTSATGLTFNTFTFDTPFEWDGTSNIAVEICYNNGTADPANFSDRVGGYIEGPNDNGNIMWQDSIDCSGAFTGGSNFGYFSQGLRPQIRFNVTTTGTVADTALNATRTEYFTSNNDLYFYSNQKVLARVKNLSAFNYGCTQVVIDRSGTGTTPFLTSYPAGNLMNKTYRVLPTTNNPSGDYEVTFYFTQAEVQGWQTATGYSFNDIQIVKVANRIDDVRPNTPNGGGTIESVTPTARGTIGSNYFLTATFTTGFSGFGFGMPYSTLPITLLDFSGKLQGDNALLQWSTSSEQNSKHFEVEKSLDGVTYRKIGTVKAAGSSSSERKYSLVDKEFALDKNYYRLNMVDNDSKAKVSNVVLIRNAKNKQGMFVINNPFNHYIDVRFGKVPQGRVKLVLSDLSGKQLQAASFNGLAQNVLRFNLASTTLSKGIYLLTAEVDGNRYAVKVMKQ